MDKFREQIANQLAERIEKKYGFRWNKCVDLATSTSWWFKDYTVDELTAIDIDGLAAEVFKQIDNDEIQ